MVRLKLQLFVVLFCAALLFGCTGGGGNATPTPVPTTVPHATATPAPTAAQQPTATQTPQAFGASPTPGSGSGLDWQTLSGCGRVGLRYTYRISSGNESIDIAYAQSEGGVTNATDSVLMTVTMTMSGMDVTTRQWSAKSDCRCLKVETEFAGSATAVACPDDGVAGAASASSVTVLDAGSEAISVPAYTGVAAKHSVAAAGGTPADYWTATGFAVPVKVAAGTMTMVLVSYSG